MGNPRRPAERRSGQGGPTAEPTRRRASSRSWQRERLEITIGVVLIVGALALGAIYLLSRTTDLFVASTPVPPTPTPEPTVIDTSPLPLNGVTMTNPVAAGDTFEVIIATEPGARCTMTARLFLYSVGNYSDLVLVDSTTDASGLCIGSMAVSEDWVPGEQALRIFVEKEGRSQEVRWSFQVVAPQQ